MKDKIMKIWNGQDGQVMMLCQERVERQEKSSFVPRGPITLISEISEVADNTQNLVVLQVPGELINDALLRQILKITKPEGYFAICDVLTSRNDVEFALKIAGFVNVEFVEDLAIVAAKKPIYEVGSSAKLNLKRPAISTVWTLDADDDETIDPDNLLDDEDLKKPDPSSLRVCGTTGKRKACKDCSCGLADELEAESKGKTLVDIPNGQKSSCGSCYLGDAFRCATCPYLGMPAFKPGEKVQLAGNLLQDDI